MPADHPSPYARIEEYIARAFDEFNILQLNQSLDHILNGLFKKTACHGAENSTEGHFNWYV